MLDDKDISDIDQYQNRQYFDPYDTVHINSDDDDHYVNSWHEREMRNHKLRAEKIIKESMFAKDAVLDLSDIRIGELPVIIKTFVWVYKIYINRCDLASLVNLPPNITELSASHNKLTEIKDGEIPENLQAMDCSDNNLYKIGKLPQTIIEIDLSDNKLFDNSVEFPFFVKVVKLDTNFYTTVPDFGSNLEVLSISHNRLKSIDNLPINLMAIDFSNNKVETIDKMPPNIIKMKGYNNRINKISYIGEYLKNLDLSKNLIRVIPLLPQEIEYVDFSENCIEIFEDYKLPDSVRIFDIRENSKIKCISMSILNDKRIRKDDENMSYVRHNIMQYANMVSDTHSESKSCISKEPSEYSSENPYYIILKRHKTI
jgi:Leucine-rich repeat (LRR) protein